MTAQQPVRRLARYSQGFTLIELLIAISLGVLVLIAAASLLISSSSSASDVQVRNELLTESQTAQNYMVWQMKEAVYVFQNGRVLTLGNTGYTTRNPVTGNGTWTIGATGAPIAAFVRPPLLLPGAPDPDGGPGLACPDDPRRCYQFVAYYPVKRSVWVSGATGINDPGEDDLNSNRWVIAEYRRNYPTPPNLAALAASPYVPPATGQGRLLVDYVRPANLLPASAPPLFQVLPAAGGTQTPGGTRVNINLALSRQVRSRTFTVPATTATSTPEQSVTTVPVVPANLGNLAP